MVDAVYKARSFYWPTIDIKNSIETAASQSSRPIYKAGTFPLQSNDLELSYILQK